MSNTNDESLKTALMQLQSEDVASQNQGVEAAVQIGIQAVPLLIPLLKDERATVRSQVMYTLAQIASPETAQVFQSGPSRSR